MSSKTQWTGRVDEILIERDAAEFLRKAAGN